ncbi:hypothetical protein DK799_13300 [Escherichia coli]|nr:hypothetical protein [Escherichia coli]EFO4042962.1 hypothetical protein [Escherichia coli]
MSGAKLLDALRLSGLHETIESEWFCRPDKAFTPHPAFGARCLMRRLTRLIRPTSSRIFLCLHPFVGRIRRSRRIRQNNGHAAKI